MMERKRQLEEGLHLNDVVIICCAQEADPTPTEEDCSGNTTLEQVISFDHLHSF